MCKRSGTGLDLACNLIVLQFHVYLALHYGLLACFLLHGPVMC